MLVPSPSGHFSHNMDLRLSGMLVSSISPLAEVACRRDLARLESLSRERSLLNMIIHLFLKCEYKRGLRRSD